MLIAVPSHTKVAEYATLKRQLGRNGRPAGGALLIRRMGSDPESIYSVRSGRIDCLLPGFRYCTSNPQAAGAVCFKEWAGDPSSAARCGLCRTRVILFCEGFDKVFQDENAHPVAIYCLLAGLISMLLLRRDSVCESCLCRIPIQAAVGV